MTSKAIPTTVGLMMIFLVGGLGIVAKAENPGDDPLPKDERVMTRAELDELHARMVEQIRQGRREYEESVENRMSRPGEPLLPEESPEMPVPGPHDEAEYYQVELRWLLIRLEDWQLETESINYLAVEGLMFKGRDEGESGWSEFTLGTDSLVIGRSDGVQGLQARRPVEAAGLLLRRLDFLHEDELCPFVMQGIKVNGSFDWGNDPGVHSVALEGLLVTKDEDQEDLPGIFHVAVEGLLFKEDDSGGSTGNRYRIAVEGLTIKTPGGFPQLDVVPVELAGLLLVEAGDSDRHQAAVEGLMITAEEREAYPWFPVEIEGPVLTGHPGGVGAGGAARGWIDGYLLPYGWPYDEFPRSYPVVVEGLMIQGTVIQEPLEDVLGEFEVRAGAGAWGPDRMVATHAGRVRINISYSAPEGMKVLGRVRYNGPDGPLEEEFDSSIWIETGNGRGDVSLSFRSERGSPMVEFRLIGAPLYL